ncbi:MAG TPA: YdeI/OmpD-associated family protein [bacterium]|nr:YdeI/OmpD-associated family protein [bacterium]
MWLRLAKKTSGTQSVSYNEALEVALCYGWIDGQKRSHSEHTWLQKFTPRARKSIWSKVNRRKALVLIRDGQMKPAKEIERAKRDGRWDAAYDSPTGMTVPRDFQAALERNLRAKAFFTRLDGRNRYAVLFRIQTAKKPATRLRRIQWFIKMMERHEVLYP